MMKWIFGEPFVFKYDKFCKWAPLWNREVSPYCINLNASAWWISEGTVVFCFLWSTVSALNTKQLFSFSSPVRQLIARWGFPVTAGKAWTAAQILSESERRLMMKICQSQSVPQPEAVQDYYQSQQSRRSLCVAKVGFAHMFAPAFVYMRKPFVYVSTHNI